MVVVMSFYIEVSNTDDVRKTQKGFKEKTMQNLKTRIIFVEAGTKLDKRSTKHE